MKKIGKISSFLSRNIGIVIILFSVIAFFQPDTFSWATNYTSSFLAAAMFGMGLSITLEDFKIVFTHPKEMLIGCLSQFTIMPLSAFALAKLFSLSPELAIGVILVGCCPGGTASNVITYIAGGDVALSVGMTTVSTLIAPLATPALVYLLGGTWVEVSFLSMVLSTVKIVLIPVLFGIVLNRLFPRQMDTVRDVLPLISVTAIVIIIAGIVGANASKIASCGFLVLIIVMLHNLIGLLLGLGIGRLTHLDYKKTTALAIEIGMQNSGLATSLAAAHFAMYPLATLPGAIFSVWHNISGSIFASIRRRTTHDAKEPLHANADITA